jgi:D-3-phosphoglycerate dehydrogenase
MAMKNIFKIKTFNKISPLGLERFPRAVYEIAGEMANADAILLRSHKVKIEAYRLDQSVVVRPDSYKFTNSVCCFQNCKLQASDIAPEVHAIARCGAGVNNIDVEECTKVNNEL